MTQCKGFRTFKERGEWVELQFMARAVRNGFKVSKPWGDSSAYDVGIESGERILRVQGEVDGLPDAVWVFVPVQAECAQQALHVEAGGLFCGVCDSRGCVVFDSGGGFVAREAEEGFDDFAGEAEASGAV